MADRSTIYVTHRVGSMEGPGNPDRWRAPEWQKHLEWAIEHPFMGGKVEVSQHWITSALRELERLAYENAALVRYWCASADVINAGDNVTAEMLEEYTDAEAALGLCPHEASDE